MSRDTNQCTLNPTIDGPHDTAPRPPALCHTLNSVIGTYGRVVRPPRTRHNVKSPSGTNGIADCNQMTCKKSLGVAFIGCPDQKTTYIHPRNRPIALKLPSQLPRFLPRAFDIVWVSDHVPARAAVSAAPRCAPPTRPFLYSEARHSRWRWSRCRWQ